LLLIATNILRSLKLTPYLQDISEQLPEDTKRFETIDKDLKELMQESERIGNVVESTNRPGLYQRLEGLQER